MSLLMRRRALLSTLTKVVKNLFHLDKVTIYNQSNGGKIKKENNSLIFDNFASNWTNYMTIYRNCVDLKPNTNYICRAFVTATNNGSANGEWSAGSMMRSLRLQTVAQNFDTKAFYIINGYNPVKGANGEIITEFTTPADLSSYKYICTRLADKISVTFKDIVIVEGDAI